MKQQPLTMQGRGFLGEAWRWVKERMAVAGGRGLRGLLALA